MIISSSAPTESVDVIFRKGALKSIQRRRTDLSWQTRMGCLVSLSRLSLPLGAGTTQKPMCLIVLRSQIPAQAGTWRPTNANNKNPWTTAISENMQLCNKGLGSWLIRSYLIYRNSSLSRQANLPCVKQAFLDRLLPTARAMSSTSSPTPLHQRAVLGCTSPRWEWDGWLR